MAGSNINPTSQTEHDNTLLRMLREYKEQTYKVYADIEGYPKPPIIGGHRPDAVVVKGKHRIIVEVETLDSLKIPYTAMRDAAFKRACRRNSTTNYRRVIAR
jgi:hypothetical protein